MEKTGRQIFLLFIISATALSGDRKVLLEMFTNAHCYSCVAAYELFRQYRITNANASKTSFVFYHITQPGVEDSIYFEDKGESDARNAYYGSHNTAPLLFVDGVYTGSNTSVWQQYINGEFSTTSPFTISIEGTIKGNTASVEAMVSLMDNVPDNDLRIHIIITESVSSYIGKNGVTPQIYAMRKMLTDASGDPLQISKGDTKKVSKSAVLNDHWDREKMWVTVFIQSASKKTVYQSEMISTTVFVPTSVGAQSQEPLNYFLEQNYPNPFNPSTVIDFFIPVSGFVSLSVFDVLGNEVARLVNEKLPSGRHSVPFDGSRLSTGIYFYKLQSGYNLSVRKMILIR